MNANPFAELDIESPSLPVGAPIKQTLEEKMKSIAQPLGLLTGILGALSAMELGAVLDTDHMFRYALIGFTVGGSVGVLRGLGHKEDQDTFKDFLKKNPLIILLLMVNLMSFSLAAWINILKNERHNVHRLGEFPLISMLMTEIGYLCFKYGSFPLSKTPVIEENDLESETAPLFVDNPFGGKR